MFSTVVGSFPVELETSPSFKDKFLNIFGLYDPYKSAIKKAVFHQLDSGVDIISDGQVRGDMVGSFSKYIPGMQFEHNSTIITSKIRAPVKEITVDDLKYAKSILKEYYSGSIPENKGVKGIITGPSTIVHSSRIESFYKNKNDAIIDLAHSLKHEVNAIMDKIDPKYIQVDEPFLSTGLVDFKTARKAIDIIGKGLDVPLAMHVCGNLNNVFKDLTKFNIDILDCEFAGNNINIGILEDNVNLIKGKKIGFGCLDTASTEVDSYDDVLNLVKRGIDAVGKENMILDPDCGLRKASVNVACKKLETMTKVLNEVK